MVHEAVLAEQSPALAALMRGEMAEGIAGASRWMDVTKGTFVRFVEFAYTRDYSVPKGFTEAQADAEATTSLPSQEEPRVLDDIEAAWQSPQAPPPAAPSFFGVRGYLPPQFAQHPSAQELDDGWDSPRPKIGKKSKSVPKPPRSASEIFRSLKYPLIESRSNVCKCNPTRNDGPVENSGDVLLAHASLYVLAEKWGVNDLKMLVLSKLQEALITLRLDSSKGQEVVDFLRYAYLDTSTPDLEPEIDGLRDLICLYTAANINLLMENSSFIDLIEGGGAFVRDLLKRIISCQPVRDTL